MTVVVRAVGISFKAAYLILVLIWLLRLAHHPLSRLLAWSSIRTKLASSNAG